ncbi:hypothetical protein MBLNU230_g8430t1 [Neophaeotheca triangularis]
MSTSTPEKEHIEHLVATKLPGSPIYAFLLTPVRIISASPGQFIARLPLADVHMNSGGSIHGSVSATIVDWAGGMVIATQDRREKTGVSVDIHVSYQSGARAGDEIEIEGMAEKVGGSLAFTRITIFKVDGEGKRGAIVVRGSHTKFVKGTGGGVKPAGT